MDCGRSGISLPCDHCDRAGEAFIFVITAFLLGLMGSLHCAGMCGPLVLMTPVVGHSRASRVASRVLYHLGRITTYALIGLLFGMIGKSIVFAGLQRWLSLVVGMLMLVIL